MFPATSFCSRLRVGARACATTAMLFMPTAWANATAPDHAMVPTLSMVPGSALSVEHAMQLAIDRAPLLAADAARISAASSDARRAGALPDPMLLLGVDNLTATGPMAGQLGADEMTMRRIGITQDWPSRAKRDARTAQASARYDESVLTQSATMLAVERAAGLAWVDRWAAETQVQLLARLHEELERGVKLAEARLRGGEGSVSELLAAKSARAEHENEMAMAEANLHAARASLARWVGEASTDELAAPLAFDRLPLSADTLRASLDRQAVVRLWDARSRSAESAVGLASAEKRPDLSFTLSYGARSGGLADMVSFEVGIGLPLFAAGRQDLDVAARRAEVDALAAEREEARRVQAQALESELALWQGQAETIERYRKTLLPLAQDRVRVALAAYSGGADIEPWLTARREAVQTNLQYSIALAEQAKRWVLFATLLPKEKP